MRRDGVVSVIGVVASLVIMRRYSVIRIILILN